MERDCTFRQVWVPTGDLGRAPVLPAWVLPSTVTGGGCRLGWATAGQCPWPPSSVSTGSESTSGFHWQLLGAVLTGALEKQDGHVYVVQAASRNTGRNSRPPAQDRADKPWLGLAAQGGP